MKDSKLASKAFKPEVETAVEVARIPVSSAFLVILGIMI